LDHFSFAFFKILLYMNWIILCLMPVILVRPSVAYMLHQLSMQILYVMEMIKSYKIHL